MKNIFGQIRSSLPAITLLILTLLAAAPLWGPGIVNTRAGGDSPFLLWRVHQMAANLRAGVFPVRWMPDAAYGYGYPFFSYYAALPFYLAGLLNVLGVDILTAIKLTQTLGLIAAAFAMYGWTRRRFAPLGAWLAAVAYTFAPFHLVNVYTRGDSLSEFYAFIFFPLILWAMGATFEKRTARSAVALVFAFGGLFVTHNLSALTFSPFVALYIGLQIPNSQYRLSKLWLCVVGLMLGLALSAWCWAPYFFEREYGQLGEQTTGYFHYSNHFRSLDLVQPTLFFDYEVGKTTPFAMGSAQAVLAVLGIGVMLGRAIRQRKLDRLAAFTLIGLLISTFMITPLAKLLWDHVPYLPIVQFPWRFLTIQAMFTAMATGQIPNTRYQTSNIKYAICNTQYLSIVLSILLAAASLIGLRPTRLYISPADVTAERLQLYEMFTANIGTTIRYEYLPRGVVPRLYTSDALIEPDRPMRAVALEGEASASQVAAAPTRQTWRVQVGTSGATVAFPILWWSGWGATVDGQPRPIRPAISSGRILLEVPGGEHTVVLSLGRTPLRAAAESVSLVVFVVVCFLLVYPTLRRHPALTGERGLPSDPRSDRRRFIAGRALSALLFVLVLLVSLVLLGARSTFHAAEDETMDFVSQPYLHHNPGGAPLGPDLKLVRYRLSADELEAGQTLNVNLDWRNTGDPQMVTVTLVSPAQHLVGLEAAPTLAESAARVAPASQSRTEHPLTIPPETPRGVYLLKVQSQAEVVYLRPVHVRSERPVGNAPVLAQFGDRIRLHRVHADQVTPMQLGVTLGWSATRPVEANYGIRVRFFGPTGNVTTPTDLESPGYGFLPTSLWWPGNLISDRYTIHLPEGTPPRGDYQVEVLLYDRATQAGVGLYVQPGIALTQFSRRPIDSSVLARFGSELALATLDVPATHPQGAPALTIRPGRLATAAPSASRMVRWTVYDSAGAAVFTQTHDLVAGAPLSAWPAGAFVVGEARLNIPVGLDPGQYRLGVTVINLATQTEEGSYLTPTTFEITGHPRSFVVPPVQHRSDVEFGQQIRLPGYDLKYQTSNVKRQITLTLYWQAISKPRGDYKVFVHVFDPTNEKIVAQHDAMPLKGQYPTSWWTAGEVVSETVTLDLKSVPPGTYRLAVGLYEPGTVTRLVAVGQGGVRLDADRAVLPETITVPK